MIDVAFVPRDELHARYVDEDKDEGPVSPSPRLRSDQRSYKNDQRTVAIACTS